MHMELQWAMWTPLAFLALHRTLDTGKWQYGLATGACVALQMLSSIYYGIFLASLDRPRRAAADGDGSQGAAAAGAVPLAAGAVLAAAISAVYAIPYMRVHERVGDRPASEVATYSARPSSYLAAPPGNWLYGRTAGLAQRIGAPPLSRRSFPSSWRSSACCCGRRRGARSSICVLLAAAFETSLGFGGYTYSFLYEHVQAYRGLRASGAAGHLRADVPRRCSRRTDTRRSPRARRAASARRSWRLCWRSACSPNTASTLALVAVHEHRPADLPHARAASRAASSRSFPCRVPTALPGDDAEYAYMSTFHWFPLVNGYSGMYPPSYLARLERLATFPTRGRSSSCGRTTSSTSSSTSSAYTDTAFSSLRERITVERRLCRAGRVRRCATGTRCSTVSGDVGVRVALLG